MRIHIVNAVFCACIIALAIPSTVECLDLKKVTEILKKSLYAKEKGKTCPSALTKFNDEAKRIKRSRSGGEWVNEVIKLETPKDGPNMAQVNTIMGKIIDEVAKMKENIKEIFKKNREPKPKVAGYLNEVMTKRTDMYDAAALLNMLVTCGPIQADLEEYLKADVRRSYSSMEFCLKTDKNTVDTCLSEFTKNIKEDDEDLATTIQMFHRVAVK